MMSSRHSLFLLLCFLSFSVAAQPRQSDYETKAAFEQKWKALKSSIATSSTTAELDSLKNQISVLEQDYQSHRAFLDKALYPETFATAIAGLREEVRQNYDRVFLIQTQGVKIDELEAQLASLIQNMDSLSVQRNSILQELQNLKRATVRMQETIRRLTANLEARDELIFALVDTVFKGYEVNVDQAREVQLDALRGRLDKVNAVERIYDIAANNVRILEQLRLQGKDYSPLIDQYRRFHQRWDALRDRLNAAYANAAGQSAKQGKGKKGAQAPAAEVKPGAQVDSILAVWDSKLLGTFWGGLYQEFTSQDLPVRAFNDATSFSTSITSYVDSMKASEADASRFVSDVWKDRIDKEWREPLSLDAVLGRAQYAALDRKVSELDEKKVDSKFLGYLAIIIAVLGAAWLFFSRRSKSRPATSPPAPADSAGKQ
jgi:FtsZ-binding cell division protein ZapB